MNLSTHLTLVAAVVSFLAPPLSAAPEKQLTGNAAQAVAAYAGKTPLIVWEASGALMLQRGTATPVRFAENAAAVSIASGPETAVIAWEATLNGAKTIFFDRVR